MFRLLQRIGLASVRQISQPFSEMNMRSIPLRRKPKYEKLADPKTHKIIYSFKYVRFCSSFLASKFHFSIASAILGSCTCIYFNNWELIPPIIVCNAIHLMFMTIASRFLDNLVGAVFVKKVGDIDEVVISAINKKGQRIDRNHNLDDIYVLDANSIMTLAGFFVVAIQNSDIKYKVNFKHGNIYNPQLCRIVFENQPFTIVVKK